MNCLDVSSCDFHPFVKQVDDFLTQPLQNFELDPKTFAKLASSCAWGFVQGIAYAVSVPFHLIAAIFCLLKGSGSQAKASLKAVLQGIIGAPFLLAAPVLLPLGIGLNALADQLENCSPLRFLQQRP